MSVPRPPLSGHYRLTVGLMAAMRDRFQQEAHQAGSDKVHSPPGGHVPSSETQRFVVHTPYHEDQSFALLRDILLGLNVLGHPSSVPDIDEDVGNRPLHDLTYFIARLEEAGILLWDPERAGAWGRDGDYASHAAVDAVPVEELRTVIHFVHDVPGPCPDLDRCPHGPSDSS